MKAKIQGSGDTWWWEIFYSNGAGAVGGPLYTRRDNAIRGLKTFVEKMWTTKGIEKIMDNV